MTDLISKQEVESTLSEIEMKYFGKTNENMGSIHISFRFNYLFVHLYVNGGDYPEGVDLLIRSYKMMCENGYYFNIE